MKIYRSSQFSPQDMKKHWDEWINTTQNVDPDASNFAVDLRSNGKSIPNSIRVPINKALARLDNYQKEIPIDEIFDILRQNNVVVLQEDGTKWSGFVTSQGECGSDKANQEPMKFQLAYSFKGRYVLANNYLIMTACTMPSENIEIVCYVS